MKRKTALLLSLLMLFPFCSCTRGGEGSSGNTSGPEPAKPRVLLIDGAEYTAAGVDTAPTGDGIYVFTPAFGDSAPTYGGEFADAAVADGVICAVYDEPAIIPKSGFVIRFCDTGDVPAAGSMVETDICESGKSCGQYARIGDRGVIELHHRNETRADCRSGYIYDNEWYAATTCTSGGRELAVADGKIIAVNDAGNTEIPEGGYVISLSAAYGAAAAAKVGDSAELCTSDPLYTVKRLVVSGYDRSRTAASAIIYTEKSGSTPVAKDASVTELSVSAQGRVILISEGVSGGTNVPKGGYVVSGPLNGSAGYFCGVREGMRAAISGDGKSIYFIEDPTVLSESLFVKREEFLARAEESFAKYPIDRMAIADRFSVADSSEKPVRAELEKLAAALDGAECLLYPEITVGDRAAWVTVGERGYSDELILHYTNEREVFHAVEYAAGLGLNTLIVDDSAGAGYAAYPTQVPGQVMAPELNGFDVLDAFSRACEKEGIRLIVMLSACPMASGNVQWQPEHYINTMSDKYLISKAGRDRDPSGLITLDPADADVRAMKIAAAKEIASGYKIFGIQFDYTRYPLPIYYQEHNYEDFGYTPAAVNGFKAKYGADPQKLSITDPLWEKWCDYRTDIISDYARELYNAVKSVDSGLNVSFTCFADAGDRKRFVYQDVARWASEGFADAIYPMIYGATTDYQQGYVDENAQALRGYPVVVGVGTYVRATVESMYEQLVMPAASLCAGSANFTLRYISVCGYDKAVRESFRTPAQPVTGTPAGETVAAMLSMVKTQLGNIRPYADIPQSADDHLASALEYSGAGDAAAAADAIARLQEALEGVCGAADFICAELEYCRVLIAAAR